ncbi:MAG: dihydrolipoyl dehydrogenase [Bdellovibrionales bacterium]|nr:dihydrolipoyl dehydrogenase [Bdellovibrionales bacterium]
MSAEEFDLIVIGSGPAGYTGAIRAAQLGLNTAVIEKDATLGGTCLNVGCIPSKALLQSSEHYHAAKADFADHGIMLDSVKLDLGKMMERKSGIVKELTDGINYLFDKNKIKRFEGLGTLKSATEVTVKKSDGSEEILKTKNIMLATGSVPNELPFLKYDGKVVVSSTEALSLPEVPKKLVVVGGGVIGLELGSVWMRLGAEVTVVEYTDMICGGMDRSTSKRMLQILKKQGMNFVLSAAVTGAEVKSDGATVQYKMLKDEKEESIDCDVVLVATGRRPYSDGLGLDSVGIPTDKRGCVEIDDHFRTSTKNIYAVGDLVAGPMLAHKAEEEGVAVAEIIAGHAGHVNYHTVPGIIYTWPEVASVGYTEEQLKEKGIKYNSGTFPFTANGRAKALGHTDGQVKILADKESDKVLGAHIVGPSAGDLIAEVTMAMEFGASAEDVGRAFHAHPTLSEIVREAALNVSKRARQM